MDDRVVRASAISGVGAALGNRVVHNSEIAPRLGVDEEWIESRTGIVERRFATPDQTTATLAADAARKAMEHAEVHPSDIDLVVVGTCSPDHPLPSTACLVQHSLEIPSAAAIDLNAACSSFVYGLSFASAMIGTGQTRRALVIGAEVLSRFLDLDDPVTAPLFGDGAGAVVLEATEAAAPIEFELGSDGSGAGNVIIPAGGSIAPASRETIAAGGHFIKMSGREVFRSAVRVMSGIGLSLGAGGFDLMIGHQANVRILRECAQVMGADDDKVYLNIARRGNTSAASIPIAISEAWSEGRLDTGDRLLLLAFGSGYTWGGAKITWQIPAATTLRQERVESEVAV